VFKTEQCSEKNISLANEMIAVFSITLFLSFSETLLFVP